MQNIDLMIAAGFCRNCLGDWYREAAAEQGVALDKDAAREIVYGMPPSNGNGAIRKTRRRNSRPRSRPRKRLTAMIEPDRCAD